MDSTLSRLIAWKRSLFLVMLSQALLIVFMTLVYANEFSVTNTLDANVFQVVRLPDILWSLKIYSNTFPLAAKKIGVCIIEGFNYLISFYVILFSVIAYLELRKRSLNKLILSLELIALFTFIFVFIIPFTSFYITLVSILFLINLLIIIVYSVYDVKFRNEKR